jgi:hypothetical protein
MPCPCRRHNNESKPRYTRKASTTKWMNMGTNECAGTNGKRFEELFGISPLRLDEYLCKCLAVGTDMHSPCNDVKPRYTRKASTTTKWMNMGTNECAVDMDNQSPCRRAAPCGCCYCLYNFVGYDLGALAPAPSPIHL